MKKATFISLFALMAFNLPNPEPKELVFKFSDSRIKSYYNNLSAIRSIVDNSQLPHDQVKFATTRIDSLLADISIQYQAQLDTAKNKKK